MEDVAIQEEPITLGQLLKVLSLVDSGGVVRSFLENEVVLVNGERDTRRGRKLRVGDEVTIHEKTYRLTTGKSG